MKKKERIVFNDEKIVVGYMEKVFGWYMLNKEEKIPLLQKIVNCCSALGFDKDDLQHVQFIVTTFFMYEQNKEAGLDMMKQATHEMTQKRSDSNLEVA